METITVRIDKTGSTKFDIKGVKGKACTDVATKLSQALGETVDMQNTSEFYDVVQDVKLERVSTF